MPLAYRREMNRLDSDGADAPETSSQQTPLDLAQMPLPVLVSIFGNLSFKDVCCCARTCKRMNRISRVRKIYW